jgi:hypothetical protein
LFEPANQAFWNAIEAERPDLVKRSRPWDRIKDATSLQSLLERSGATQVHVVAEAGSHALTCPEDWWLMVLGGGFRETIDQLDAAAQERVRGANLQVLRDGAIQALDVTVLYAIAEKLMD